MKTLRSIKKLKAAIYNIKNLGFVPTMGGLHDGHLSLINKCQKKCDKTLVSIYVNPKQFNSKNDFINYPRNLRRDINILKKLKVDYLYLPSYRDLFSFKTKNHDYLHNFSKKLCGKHRKGHFEGVVNVVNRFLEIIKPKYMLLGKKDFQQIFLIKKHIEKNKINTKVIQCNTVREKNGIACSSRNFNLNKKETENLSKIIKFLKKNKRLMDIKKISKVIKSFNVKKIDYIELLNTKTLKKPKNKKLKFNIFVAFYLGKVRVIDNF